MVEKRQRSEAETLAAVTVEALEGLTAEVFRARFLGLPEWPAVAVGAFHRGADPIEERFNAQLMALTRFARRRYDRARRAEADLRRGRRGDPLRPKAFAADARVALALAEVLLERRHAYLVAVEVAPSRRPTFRLDTRGRLELASGQALAPSSEAGGRNGPPVQEPPPPADPLLEAWMAALDALPDASARSAQARKDLRDWVRAGGPMPPLDPSHEQHPKASPFPPADGGAP